jgi:uncharacterized surface protein with fasciclin (FAS1) repeats
MQKKLAVLLAALFLCAIALPARAVDLLEAANNSGSFKSFLAAFKTAGLTDKLKTGDPFTVFAPTDAAFSALPDGAWEQLLKNKPKLVRVLTYHLMHGKVKVTEIKPGETASAEGSLLQLKSDNGMVTVNDARVTESDIVADNGVIHAIDKVLMPPD